jgi:hypothetical protein
VKHPSKFYSKTNKYSSIQAIGSLYQPSPPWALRKPRLGKAQSAIRKPTAWAVYQHRAALALLEDIEIALKVPDDFAQELNEAPARLKRKLYGQTPAAIDDLLNWALRYVIRVLPAIEGSYGLGIKPIGHK